MTLYLPDALVRYLKTFKPSALLLVAVASVAIVIVISPQPERSAQAAIHSPAVFDALATPATSTTGYSPAPMPVLEPTPAPSTTLPRSTTTAPKKSKKREKTTEPTEPSPAPPSPTTTVPTQTTTAPPTTTTTEASGGFNSAYENQFASLINDARADVGKKSLKRSGSLDSEARSWAKKMAKDADLSHSDIGRFLGKWSSVGENIAYGGSVSSIFNNLYNSSGHRNNMLGGFTHMGIGVWVDGGGVIWTTHVFAK